MSFILALLELIFYVVLGSSYAAAGGRYASAVSSRCRRSLGVIPFLTVALAWPIPVALWLLTCTVTRTKRPSPFSRQHEFADLTAKQAEIETARDWDRRATHWFAEGKRAELENDQALKWIVAENLAFLLDTRPPGVETPDERAERVAEMNAIKEAEKADRSAHAEPEPPRKYVKTSIAMAADEIARKVKNVYGVPPAQFTDDDHWVGLCNLCSRYRESNQLVMKGVCRDCADEQGIR